MNQLTWPLAVLANAAAIFLTFLFSIPSIIFKTRCWHRIYTLLIIGCAILTLGAGLNIWLTNLQTRHDLHSFWGMQSAAEQSLLQNQFSCCGYFDSISPPFITDNVCMTAETAVSLGGCASAFGLYANHALAVVFAIIFGIAGEFLRSTLYFL